MDVIGFKFYPFTAKDTGEIIDMCCLYCTEERKNVTGVSCENVNISVKKLDGYAPQVGDEVKVYYNKFGKPQTIEKV